MKRLVKKSDYYNEDLYKENVEQTLTNCAKYYCDIEGVNENTIEISKFSNITTVSFGNIQEDGYEVSIDIWDVDTKREINRIILSAGKNSKGKSIYVETREQTILDSFFNKSDEFFNWMNEALDKVESQF